MNLHIWSNIMTCSIAGNMKFLSHRAYIRIMKYHIILVYYSVCSLTQLEELDLLNNTELTTLPDRAGDLKSLKKLNVSECNITQLPDRWVNHCSWPFISSLLIFIHTLIDGTLIIITYKCAFFGLKPWVEYIFPKPLNLFRHIYYWKY